MSVKIELELVPFAVPDHVTLASGSAQKPIIDNNGFALSPKYKLSCLDYETLDKLCNEFRENVFKMAKIEDTKNKKNS